MLLPLLVPRTRPGPSDKAVGSTQDRTPSRGAWPTRPEQYAGWEGEAYQDGLIGQSLAGHVVESPITALGSNVSQPYNTPGSVVEAREWHSRS